MELSADLPTPLVPLAWLIGRWEGAGVVGYPSIESANFGQEVEFRHDGRPFLHYRSQAWLLDDDGAKVRPLASETGYWRPGPDGDVEVLLAHPTGYVEIYVGSVEGPASMKGRPRRDGDRGIIRRPVTCVFTLRREGSMDVVRM